MKTFIDDVRQESTKESSSRITQPTDTQIDLDP